MKTNYNLKMNDIISSLKSVPKILLHSCCGPCSTWCITKLTKYFDITVLYYNPNIEPQEEYEKRKKEQIKFINEFKPDVIISVHCMFTKAVSRLLKKNHLEIPVLLIKHLHQKLYLLIVKTKKIFETLKLN